MSVGASSGAGSFLVPVPSRTMSSALFEGGRPQAVSAGRNMSKIATIASTPEPLGKYRRGRSLAPTIFLKAAPGVRSLLLDIIVMRSIGSGFTVLPFLPARSRPRCRFCAFYNCTMGAWSEPVRRFGGGGKALSDPNAVPAEFQDGDLPDRGGAAP